MTVPYRDAFLDPSAPSFSRTTTTTNSTTKWGPYTGARDFGISMVIVLVILFCTLLLAITAVAFIRLILSARRDRQQRRQSQPADPEKPAPLRETHLPTLAFSEGAKLAGVGAECAICLTEFVDGDGVRVLPACNHGFHVRCIEEWLASRCSCPTCRRSCLVAAEPPAGKVGIEVV